MIQILTGLALGIVIFAVTIGVGLVVLSKFGDAVGGTANTTIQELMGDTKRSWSISNLGRCYHRISSWFSIHRYADG